MLFVCDEIQTQHSLVFIYDCGMVLSDGDFLLNCLCSTGEHQGLPLSARSALDVRGCFSLSWPSDLLQTVLIFLYVYSSAYLSDSLYPSLMLDLLSHGSLLFDLPFCGKTMNPSSFPRKGKWKVIFLKTCVAENTCHNTLHVRKYFNFILASQIINNLTRYIILGWK